MLIEALLLLLLNIGSYKVYGDQGLLTTSSDSQQIEKIAECVLKLSAKYFVEKKALSGSIVIININSYTSSTEKILLQTIHSGLKYSVMVKDSVYPHANASHFPEKAKNYMLILEDQSELTRNILQLNKLPTWNPHAKAVVYYQVKDEEDGIKIAIDFINELRHFKLLKSIIFLYYPQNEEVVSYTWRPYNDTKCASACDAVFVLDKCKEGKLRQEERQRDMFPKNMNGCPLIVFAVVSEPYVMPPVAKLHNNTFNDSYIFKSGGEINLVKIISQFTNMSLIVRMSSTPENWGVIEQNGTAFGAYGILRNDDADLMIGNIEVTRTIRKWFDPTVSYTQDEMTWCVPKAGQASTWNNLVTIFQWSTWLATLLSLIFMGLLFHYIYYKENKDKVTKWPTYSLLMTFSMLLGWGTSFEPKSATFRILIFGWLCFSMNMGISYESFLRSFLMYPRFEKQIRSESDIINSGLELGGRDIYKPHFELNNGSNFYLYRNYNSTSFADGVRRTALQRDFAVVASKRQAIYQDEMIGKGEKLIYCFSESNNLYKYGVVLLARKWFPMLDRINNIIRSVSENGLINKWNNELFLHTSSSEDVTDIVPLGTQHLLGAFMFIGIMYGVSIILFIGELMWYRLGKRTKPCRMRILPK